MNSNSYICGLTRQGLELNRKLMADRYSMLLDIAGFKIESDDLLTLWIVVQAVN